MTVQDIPTISRTCSDGTLIEALYDPDAATTALAIGRLGGTANIEADLVLPAGERLVPYSPQNNLIASGCVLLPSSVGAMKDKGDLVDDIRVYLRRYVILSPTFEAIAAYYVLLTWVYDAFNELPYLRFRGDYGTGKTRALLTVGSICYKPFFASGASTVSPLFHVLDAFGGTLVLDEADFRFSDVTAELTKILNNGNMRGLPVLRTMTNRHRELNPTAFRVFGPKIIAMRESFSDRALESRFLTEETGAQPVPSDIPIHLPDSLAVEARELRNRLLAWRFQARHKVGPNPERLLANASPRANQTASALLALIDDEQLRARVGEYVTGEERSRTERARSSTDARVVAALAAALKEAVTAYVPLADVAERFNRSSGNLQVPLTNKAVGTMVRRLGVATTKSRGVYVIPHTERERVRVLASRYGIADVAGDAPACETPA
jgi:hypothetical protein